MITDRIDVIFQENWLCTRFDVYLVTRDRDGQVTAAASPVIMERVDEGRSPSGPAFSLPRPDCQAVMDALYRAGFRPTDAAEQTGAMAAAREHIADLRRVTFTLLDVMATPENTDRVLIPPSDSDPAHAVPQPDVSEPPPGPAPTTEGP